VGRHAVHEGARLDAGFGRGARDLLPVLVGSGQEVGGVPALAVVAGPAPAVVADEVAEADEVAAVDVAEREPMSIIIKSGQVEHEAYLR